MPATFDPNNLSEKDNWYTPPDLFTSLLNAYRMEKVFDCAASEHSFNLHSQVTDYASLEGVNFQTIVKFLLQNSQPLTNFWCNPPFSDISGFAAAFQNLHQAGLLGDGIILSNSNTEVNWYRTLASFSPVILLLKQRVGFINGSVYDKTGEAIKVKGNMKPQTIFFTGQVEKLDFEALAKLGTVLYNPQAITNSIAAAENLNVRLLAIFILVQKELMRQRVKFGHQHTNSQAKWVEILQEEVGEVAEEVVKKSSSDQYPNGYTDELVQVAAVACSMLSYSHVTPEDYSQEDKVILEVIALAGNMVRFKLDQRPSE